MSDQIGEDIERTQTQLETMRSTLDSHAQEIAELVLPMMAEFGTITTNVTKGRKKTSKLLEGTAPLALFRYASAIESFLTPRSEVWHRITTDNPDLNKDKETKLWFDKLNTLLFATRYEPKTNFASQIHENIMAIGAFGTTGLFVDSVISNLGNGQQYGMTYKSVPLSQLYITEDAQGTVNRVHRKYPLTAAQAKRAFGEVPQRIESQLATNPHQEFTFVHAVFENEDFRPGALGPKGMKFVSVNVLIEERETLSVGGFTTLRYAIGRGPKGPGEVYGRSPAMTILPEIKSVNEMRRSLLRQQHMSLSPPTLLHSERPLNLRLMPSAQNPGTLTADGKPLVVPMPQGASFTPVEKEMERIRELINDAFLVTLFQILINNPRQTATETLQRAKEQASLVGPVIGRLQSEFLSQIIESEIAIHSEMGGLPEMPEALVEAQGEFTITYESEITRAQRAASIESYSLWLPDAAAVASVKPEVLEVVKHEDLLRDSAEKRGIPHRFIRTEDELAAKRRQDQEAAAQQRQQEALPDISAAEKDLAQAQAISAGV